MDKTKSAVEVFNKYALQYQDKFMNVDLYGEALNIFCDTLKNGATVLDVACGPGNVTHYLLQQRPDFKILGIDLAPQMLELAKANNPAADFRLMDGRDIGKLTNSFDGIICSFLFPYLSKDEATRFIADAYGLLNTEGILYISTMEGDYNLSGWETSAKGDKMFMHYYEAQWLTGALEEHHFKLTDLQRKVYPKDEKTMVTDLIILAVKP